MMGDSIHLFFLLTLYHGGGSVFIMYIVPNLRAARDSLLLDKIFLAFIE